MSFHENSKRSLLKAATYRLISIMVDGIIVFAITGRYDVTVWILVVSNIASAFIYFFHERFWNNIHWGKSRRE